MLLLLAQALYVGNAACNPCHADIVRSYQKTPMARSSGRVNGSVPEGDFRDAPSGTTYKVNAGGTVRLDRGDRQEERKLAYFIGSGNVGQSFLEMAAGFLFEAPITWYARLQQWDVSPGFADEPVSRWNRAVEPECLNCHASQIRFAPGYRNRYADPPWAQDGVGCERCHGPGSEHIAGRGRMVQPAKLDAARRDSVCAQCHLSGEARVDRAGRHWREFRAGELLSTYSAYFVREGQTQELRATGYVEKLSASGCKRASGDKLWCGTCHDAHRVPAAAERVPWFRQKCLACHNTADCRRGEDCAGCHMPKGRVVDGGHGVLTDHSIPKRAGGETKPEAPGWKLRPFTAADAGERELGLAYAEKATQTRDARQQEEALRLLRGVTVDEAVALALGALYQQRGEAARAAEMYREALRRNPNSPVALVNVGKALGSHGRVEEAVALWREALRKSPCLAEAAANLRVALEATGRKSELAGLEETYRSCIF